MKANVKYVRNYDRNVGTKSCEYRFKSFHTSRGPLNTHEPNRFIFSQSSQVCVLKFCKFDDTKGVKIAFKG